MELVQRSEIELHFLDIQEGKNIFMPEFQSLLRFVLITPATNLFFAILKTSVVEATSNNLLLDVPISSPAPASEAVLDESAITPFWLMFEYLPNVPSIRCSFFSGIDQAACHSLLVHAT